MLEEEILLKYMSKVNYFAHLYSQNNIENEDLIQEGLIGLVSAIRNYDNNNKCSFSTYASYCIRNRIIDYLRYFKKDDLYTELVESVDLSINLEEEIVFQDLLETLKLELSQLENEVLSLLIEGYTNSMIAEKLNISIESVYNSKQRIKQKISLHFK